jgi:histidyl-tRNA synthetase
MTKPDKIQGVRGMNDALPVDEARWQRLEDAVASVMRAYGYQRIRTPILEHTRLFVRGIGEVTDIVEKEMYSFKDQLNGEDLSLRPENTAGVVRAVIEHNLLYAGPKRLWYTGPMFRHERPQKGRYRQFHQVGAEALGLAGPDADAELILLCRRLWDDLGIGGVTLEINTLGQIAERRAHREALIAYFEAHRSQLDGDALRRLHANPLRILDTKNPAMQDLVERAPRLIDFLGPQSLEHFERLKALLTAQNLPFRVNPRLVRGLDYYNLTVFEWVADGLTICGGGRYDPLVEMLGGRPAPGCGFALGVERVLELLKQQDLARDDAQCDVYVVHAGGGSDAAALTVAERLRDAGLDVLGHCGGGAFRSQFKRADESGATYAVVLGDDELARGEAIVKWLRDEGGERAAGRQDHVPLDRLVDYLVEAMVAQSDDEEREADSTQASDRTIH